MYDEYGDSFDWSLMLFNPIIIFLVAYAISAVSLYVIAKKLNQDNTWMAFVPVLNIVLLLKMANRPIWWIILALIPPITVYLYVMIFHRGISKRTGHGHVWTIGIVLLPFIFLPITAMSRIGENNGVIVPQKTTEKISSTDPIIQHVGDPIKPNNPSAIEAGGSIFLGLLLGFIFTIFFFAFLVGTGSSKEPVSDGFYGWSIIIYFMLLVGVVLGPYTFATRGYKSEKITFKGTFTSILKIGAFIVYTLTYSNLYLVLFVSFGFTELSFAHLFAFIAGFIIGYKILGYIIRLLTDKYSIKNTPVSPQSSDMTLEGVLTKIDVSDIESVRFQENNSGKEYTIGLDSIKRIAQYMIEKSGKNSFSANELLQEKEFLIKNYKSQLPENDYATLVSTLSSWVENGGTLEIVKKK